MGAEACGIFCVAIASQMPAAARAASVCARKTRISECSRSRPCSLSCLLLGLDLDLLLDSVPCALSEEDSLRLDVSPSCVLTVCGGDDATLMSWKHWKTQRVEDMDEEVDALRLRARLPFLPC